MSDPTVVTLRDVRRRRRSLILRITIAAVCVLVIAGLAYAWHFNQRIKASLPQLDGDTPLAGLSADVTITRDNLGVPTITAATRLDAARALGFLHAQDRFFQMDLARRRAAGELSELFGEKTLAADKAVRIHGLRAIAQKSLALLPESQRALLDAYTVGVNTGLSQLREPPFEYILLGEKPRAWLPEDSILVIHAMAIDLQHPDAAHELTLGAIRDYYDNSVMAYFAPVILPDDSAFDGSTAPLPPIPKPSSINLRETYAASGPQTASAQPEASPYHYVASAETILARASSSMAVASKTGPGLIENDMHLTLRVPNTWYRVSMHVQESGLESPPAASKGRSPVTITGITHPGAPAVVAGSNGKIAWAFTNSFADTSDVIAIIPDRSNPNVYFDNKEFRTFEYRTEKIIVRGKKDPVSLQVETSHYGPTIGANSIGQKIALKWVFHDPVAANYDIVDLETATNIPAAIVIANRAGIPAQNMLIADTTGDIGWTICGRLPERFGYDGRAPATWAYGDRGWRGLLPPEKTPAMMRSAPGHLSTANQRLVSGDALEILSDGGYRSGERGARIDALLEKLPQDRPAAPRDLLAVSLDDYAPHLARWHKLLRDTLASATSRKLTNLRAAAGETWDEATPGAHATTDATAYAVVRQFREHVIARILKPVFEPCAGLYPNFNYNRLRVEEPVWNIVRQKPMHLLDTDYATWDDLFLAAAEDARRDISDAGYSNPTEARWGAFNVSRIRHPLSGGALGLVGHLLNLDMPMQQLPGDDNMPRVQYPDYGASMRMVVAPGDEAHGIYHMPAGQSGNPSSPYYRAGHDAWAKGEPTPFLPGAPEHTLVLKAK